jgi:hypothetical protein
LVKNIPMIIHLQFGFSQFICFREEDLWNFIQSEHIIGPGSHVEYPTGTKNRNIVEDHTRNVSAKFGSNWPSGCGEEAWNVKSLQTTDDGRQVMAIVWSRWTKNWQRFLHLFFLLNIQKQHTESIIYMLSFRMWQNWEYFQKKNIMGHSIGVPSYDFVMKITLKCNI